MSAQTFSGTEPVGGALGLCGANAVTRKTPLCRAEHCWLKGAEIVFGVWIDSQDV